MPTFKIYLKDKPLHSVVEADEAELDNVTLDLKKDKKIVAQFRAVEVQGYCQES